MKIFSNSVSLESGAVMTVDEFRKIVESDLIEDLVTVIIDLQGELILEGESVMEEGIPEEIMRDINQALSNLNYHQEPSEEDQKVVNIMRLLGYIE